MTSIVVLAANGVVSGPISAAVARALGLKSPARRREVPSVRMRIAVSLLIVAEWLLLADGAPAPPGVPPPPPSAGAAKKQALTQSSRKHTPSYIEAQDRAKSSPVITLIQDERKRLSDEREDRYNLWEK